MNPYDRSYSSTDNLFGEAPEDSLLRYIDHLDPRLPVLDIGAGQGRNTLPVARAGFTVDALDSSEVGLNALRQKAETAQLSVRLFLGGFDEHDAPRSHSYVGL